MFQKLGTEEALSDEGRHEVRARLGALAARLGGVLGAGMPVEDLRALQADRPAPFQLDTDAKAMELDKPKTEAEIYDWSFLPK